MAYYVNLAPYIIYPNYPNYTNYLDYTNSLIKQFVTGPSYINTYNVPSYNGSDDTVRRKVVKYFHNKTIDHWLKQSQMSDLLKLLNVSNGKVVISNDANNNTQSESKADRDMKIDFIAKHVLTINNMRDIIYRFVQKYNIAFINLHDNKELVKDYIYEKLRKMLTINNK
jgi:hypothetical protein